MIMENVLFYLLSFLVYVIIQAIVINGIKACTEGNYEDMPDGKKVAKGMIFFKIANYLNQKELIPVYYSGDGIKRLLEACKEKFGNSIPISFLEGKVNNTILKIAQPDLQEQVMIQQFRETILRKSENAKCDKWSDDEYVFYKEYERYKFPKFIRKSVALGCIRCASSFWGTITFLPVVFYFGLNVWVVVCWLFSLLSLVYWNQFFYKKL